MSKFITFFVLFAILFFAASYARADKYHHSEPANETIINEVIINEAANGTALAIATSQLSTDWSTRDYQVGIGFGSFDGEDAISLGVGKRIDRMLIKGSIGRESNKYGYGFSVNFHF